LVAAFNIYGGKNGYRFPNKNESALKLFKAGKYSEADILNMKTEEMLDLPNVSIKEIKVICAIKEAVKKHTLYSYLGGKQDER